MGKDKSIVSYFCMMRYRSKNTKITWGNPSPTYTHSMFIWHSTRLVVFIWNEHGNDIIHVFCLVCKSSMAMKEQSDLIRGGVTFSVFLILSYPCWSCADFNLNIPVHRWQQLVASIICEVTNTAWKLIYNNWSLRQV